MVVIVDDEAVLRNLFELVLQQRGHDVATAASHDEASEVCRRLHPDVVTLDMLMPQGSGVELIRTLRADTPGVRILAVSGNSDLLPAAIDAGASLTLAKPFSPDQLIAAVEGLLDGVRP